MDTIEIRVARGAKWLDVKYPGWWQVIDLGTLELSSCNRCVLGQVYSKVIPEGERSQLLAQVLGTMARPERLEAMGEMAEGTRWGGYNVLRAKHDLWEFAPKLGFSIDWQRMWSNGRILDAPEEFVALTDEWTRVILTRRIEAHPDVRAMTQRLDQVRMEVLAG